MKKNILPRFLGNKLSRIIFLVLILGGISLSSVSVVYSFNLEEEYGKHLDSVVDACLAGCDFGDRYDEKCAENCNTCNFKISEQLLDKITGPYGQCRDQDCTNKCGNEYDAAGRIPEFTEWKNCIDQCSIPCEKTAADRIQQIRIELETCIRSGGGVIPTAKEVEQELIASPAVSDVSEETDTISESPQVEISSRNLKSLLRAMNEFQAAQAELEEIKKANDPAWQAKKDFAMQYNEALEDLPSETQLRLKALRTKLEYVKDAAGIPGDIEDFSNYLQGKGFSASNRAGKVAEVGEGIITFLDLMNEGTSFENAATKATIDTVAPSLFYLFPPLKAADLVATLPDDIMGAVGIGEDHWSRTTTGFLADNSPSAFVEVTTSAMVKTNTWTNVGGAFQVAWEDVKEAEGIGGKAKATLDLVGTAVGAVPVAIAMRTRDQVVMAVDAVKMGASGVGRVISGWFTLPD